MTQIGATVPGVEFPANYSQRLACVLVLDASSSMSVGGRIDQVNKGLADLEKSLKTDDFAADRVQLAVVKVQSDASILHDWVDASEFEAPTMTAGGSTALGEGVALALNMLDERKTFYRQNGIPYLRPWVFVMTDGGATDHGWEHKAASARQAERNGKAIVWPIAVDGADINGLKLFKDDGTVLEISGTDFRELFIWISSSLSQSSSRGPDEAVQIPVPSFIKVRT